jgi:hypothetical protein
MAEAKELYFQNLSTVHGPLQPKPVSIVAAATIAPTTFLTIITGTTAVATITPPVDGAHMLAIVAAATNFAGFLTSGNIAHASLTNSTFWANKMTLLVYNPLTAKYLPLYPGPVAATNA